MLPYRMHSIPVCYPTRMHSIPSCECPAWAISISSIRVVPSPNVPPAGLTQTEFGLCQVRLGEGGVVPKHFAASKLIVKLNLCDLKKKEKDSIILYK